jgi:pyridoxine 4-dehydrogenase
VVRSVAAELVATPSQVGLAWLLARSPNTLLIPGTSSIGHLEENLGAGDVVLDGTSWPGSTPSTPPRRTS